MNLLGSDIRKRDNAAAITPQILCVHELRGTLKPRLHERLRNSKNILLFLSSHTKSSRALDEEITYGLGTLGFPVIVIYPGIEDNLPASSQSDIVAQLYLHYLPSFKKFASLVPTLHIPMKKECLTEALQDERFMVETKTKPGK